MDEIIWLLDSGLGDLLEMAPEEVLRRGKQPAAVMARRVLCYFATRELGLSTVELAKRLQLAQVSQATQRGEKN